MAIEIRKKSFTIPAEIEEKRGFEVQFRPVSRTYYKLILMVGGKPQRTLGTYQRNQTAQRWKRYYEKKFITT